MLEKLSLCVLDERLGICRFNPTEEIPKWITKEKWYSITRTMDELSIVCEEKIIPTQVKYEEGWRSLKVIGPLDFNMIGVLAAISHVLAEKGISIFVISTFDTDYILVKEALLARTIEALRESGCKINND